MIVKVQQSFHTITGGEVRVLVYNKDRSVMGEFARDSQLAALLGRSLKSFWYATKPKNVRQGKLTLDRKAPWQKW